MGGVFTQPGPIAEVVGYIRSPRLSRASGPGALENRASSRLKANAASFGNCAGRSSVFRLQGAIDVECSVSCNKRRWQRGYAMVCRITDDIINALQHCRLKAYFQLHGEAGAPCGYEKLLIEKRANVQRKATERTRREQ